MKELFQEQDDVRGFKINKDFANKFEHRKKREHFEKAKQTMGKDFNKIVNDEDLSQSSYSSEDSDGKLINPKVQQDFLLAISKLRNKDKSLYKQDTELFNEQEQIEENNKNKDKKVSYKDMVREKIQKKIKDQDYDSVSSSEEFDKNQNIETPNEEQQRIKNEFKNAFKLQENDDIFKIKSKSEKEKQNQQNEYQNFVKNSQSEILEGFWGKDAKLNEGDQFLKNYILNQGWIDKDDLNYDKRVDKEDEERDEDFEEFEHKYNFRFEEPGGAEIQTYERNIESVRQTNDQRKDKRELKKQKEIEMKQKLETEVKQLKNIKKQQISDRLKKLQQISNNQQFVQDQVFYIQLKNTNNFIEEEYNSQDYDQKMDELFGEDYYDDEECDDESIDKYIEDLDDQDNDTIKVKEEKEEKKVNKDTDKDNVILIKPNIPVAIKKNMNKEEVNAMQESGNQIWYYCDNCLKGIQPMQMRFDCQECADYTLCKKCKDFNEHDHQFKKQIVPDKCFPPSDEEIKQLLDQFKYCQVCTIKLNEYNQYYQHKTKEDKVFCEQCYQSQSNKLTINYELIEATLIDYDNCEVDQIKDKVQDDELNKLVEEYYALDFEDVIAGGTKTRFKYVNVGKNDYGLNDETLIYSDDKLLNSLVSIKKLAPYRDDQGFVKESKLKKKVEYLEKNAKINKKIMKSELKQIDKYEEKLQKLKNKKNKNYDEFNKLVNKIKDLKSQQKQQKQKEQKEYNNIEIEDLSGVEPAITKKTKKSQVSDDRLKSYGI